MYSVQCCTVFTCFTFRFGNSISRNNSLSNHCAHLDCGWSTSSLLCEGLIQSSRNKEEIKRPLSVTLKTHFRSEGQLRAFFQGEKSGENGTQIGIYFLRHTFSRGNLYCYLCTVALSILNWAKSRHYHK